MFESHGWYIDSFSSRKPKHAHFNIKGDIYQVVCLQIP